MSATTTARRRVLRFPVGGAAEHGLTSSRSRSRWSPGGRRAAHGDDAPPGHDIDLAAGFLFTEGLLGRLDGVQDAACATANVADHNSPQAPRFATRPRTRPSAARSSWPGQCLRVCSKDGVEASGSSSSVRRAAAGPVPGLPGMLAACRTLRTRSRLSADQGLRLRPGCPGGRHAARPAGGLGRHDAVDRWPAGRYVPACCRWPADLLLVSGRASFGSARSDHDQRAGAGRGVHAVLAGRVAGRGGRPDLHQVLHQHHDEHLHQRPADQRLHQHQRLRRSRRRRQTSCRSARRGGPAPSGARRSRSPARNWLCTSRSLNSATTRSSLIALRHLVRPWRGRSARPGASRPGAG